jgi:hypothetical protein
MLKLAMSAGDTAMGHHHCVARQGGVPGAYARSDVAVTFAARRLESPLVFFAPRQQVRVAGLNLRQRRALPLAIGNFHQPIVNVIRAWIETERGAGELHCFPPSLQRARHISVIVRVPLLAREQILEQAATLPGLFAAAGVERGLVLPLQALSDVEISLAVTDEIGDGHDRVDL